mgnify:CR=1 FL=1
MNLVQKYINDPSFLLRLGPALVMLFFGIDQFRNPGNWLQYVPSWAVNMTGISPYTILRLHSIVNIVLGILLFTYRSKAVVWVVFFWFLSILPFAFMGDWTVGLRDTAITLGLLALTRLI